MTTDRALVLKKKTGSDLAAFQKDLEFSANSILIEDGAESFLTKISYQDRERLRAIVKKVHLRHHPMEQITDWEADRVIEAMGPQTQEHLIKKAMDHGLFA